MCPGPAEQPAAPLLPLYTPRATATQPLPLVPKFRSHQEIPSLVKISEDKMTENCWQSLTGAKHTQITHSSWKISAICTLGNCTVFRNETNHYHLETFPADTISPRGFLTDLKSLAAGISVLRGISNFHSGIRELSKLFTKVAGICLIFLLSKDFALTILSGLL